MNEQLAKQIEQWIQDHEEEMLEDIKRICRIRSVSNAESEVQPYGEGCRKVLDEMLAIGKEHGFITHNYEYQCGSLCLEEGDMDNTIGFWGHLDVVPEGDNWQYTAPYEPIIKDGFMIGRGVSDNKGPTIATMYILQCLKELGIPMKHHLKMFVGCDEEAGMRDTAYYAANYPCPAMSIIADSGFPVCYGEKGILEADLAADALVSDVILELSAGRASNMVADLAEMKLKKTPEVQKGLTKLQEDIQIQEEENAYTLTAKGISRHTAHPYGAMNAILKLTEALETAEFLTESDRKALAFMSEVNRDFNGAGLNIAFEDELSGPLTCVGSMAGIRDGHLYLHVNIRYSITKDGEQLMQEIEEQCKANGFTEQVRMHSKPNYYPKEKPAVGLLTRLYNEVAGDDKEAFVMGGGTYARTLPNALAFGMGLPEGKGTKSDLFVPGHGGAHEPDEGLCIADLKMAMKIFALCLIEMNDFSL